MTDKHFKKGVYGGFSLIEMLVVIVIIMILAMIALGNFSGARKRAQVDLAVDSVVSAINQQKGKARSGRVAQVSGEDVAGVFEQGVQAAGGLICYGIVLSTGELEAVGRDGESSKFVQYIETPYYRVKAIENKADYCDLSAKKMIAFDGDPGVEIQGIFSGDVDDGVGQVVILFKPPFGKGVVFDSLQVGGNEVDSDLRIGVTMENLYNDEEDADFLKFINYKNATDSAERE